MASSAYPISIITVNLNNRAGLEKTIASVEAQTCRDFEWIVIDGGSTDGSRELITQHADRISYWVSEPDGGIYNGMNKGIRASHGAYLLFLNSGDYLYDPHVLAHVTAQLQDADLYIGQELRNNKWLLDPKVEDTAELCEFQFVRYIPHQSTFICRKAFETYGLYDEDKKLASDWCFFYRAIILGKATIKKLPFIVSVFDTAGLSTTHSWLGSAEKRDFLKDISRFNYMAEFYRTNYEIIKALKQSKIAFFFFRIYYFFYRKRTTGCL